MFFDSVKFKVMFDGFEQPYTSLVDSAVSWYVFGLRGGADYRVDLLYSVDGGNEWIAYDRQHKKTLKDSDFIEATTNDLKEQLLQLSDYYPGDEG